MLRWLGESALRAGLSQEELARRLNAIDGGRLTGANVAQHFAAKKPSVQIVRKYAKALGYNDEFIDLLLASSLSAAQVEKWLADIELHFEAHQSWFQHGACTRILESLKKNEVVMHAALRSHALAELASWHQFPRPGWMALPSELYWFGISALPCVDIRSELLPRAHGVDFLHDIYLSAMPFYGSESAVAPFLDAVASILRIQGFDTKPMFERLEVHKAELRAFEKFRDQSLLDRTKS